jgi:DNA-binding LytR/AlgR family response regulator
MKQLYASGDGNGSFNMDSLVKELQERLQPKEYRKRFLVKHGQKLVSIELDEIAYFFSDGRLNFFKTDDNRKFVVDYTMDELEDMLDPQKVFPHQPCILCFRKKHQPDT